MKKTIFSILLALLLINMSCNSQKKTASDDLTIDYQIQSSYILFPVEEKAPEIKIKVCTSETNDRPIYDVHLALNHIDYWVPLDVKKWRGQKLALSFQGMHESSLGINEIKQTNRFDFNYNETYRPQFHFSPEHGWMNDPNGMVYLDGEYHLFYQYNPYGSMWGNMHWGHAVSTDMVSWTYLPIAIAPDSLGTIFSGSAVVDVNNTAGFGKNAMIAIYTSNGKTQQQSISYSTDKGRTFVKYAHNPVLRNPGIADFRDPKVSWNEASRQWVMALATKQTITFYGSPDMKAWTKLSEFGEGIGSHTGVWECPDLFPLNFKGKTKWILLVSSGGVPNGGTATQYFIGTFDGTRFTADPLPYPLWVDYGRDNYAGVTWGNLPSKDGRRIFLGWMSNWDYANQSPTQNFRSAMTVPRELTLMNNGKHLILANYPTIEVNTLRGSGKTFPNQQIEKEVTIPELLKVNGGTYEIEMSIKPDKTSIFGFGLTNTKGEYLNFTFDLTSNQFRIDRHKSGKVDFNDKFKAGMSAPLVKRNTYTIRLLIDKASAEIFINKGELAMTTLFFPCEIMNKMTFFSPEGKWNAENITIYNIK
ncbi:MAG: GH32 C-terminal domain-containing protein [Bacteroidota bacterium]|nr:GH32 C-terminal domain-containing protein [Bacteroidota bacterium]